MSRVWASLVVAAVALTAVGSVQASARPALRVVDERPLVVRGYGFRPRERVAVAAQASAGQQRVVVRASTLGRLAVTFRLPVLPCTGTLVLRAVGSGGSRAALRVPVPPCVPPPIR
jgi:hypothetical protein